MAAKMGLRNLDPYPWALQILVKSPCPQFTLKDGNSPLPPMYWKSESEFGDLQTFFIWGFTKFVSPNIVFDIRQYTALMT